MMWQPRRSERHSGAIGRVSKPLCSFQFCSQYLDGVVLFSQLEPLLLEQQVLLLISLLWLALPRRRGGCHPTRCHAPISFSLERSADGLVWEPLSTLWSWAVVRQSSLVPLHLMDQPLNIVVFLDVMLNQELDFILLLFCFQFPISSFLVMLHELRGIDISWRILVKIFSMLSMKKANGSKVLHEGVTRLLWTTLSDGCTVWWIVWERRSTPP